MFSQVPGALLRAILIAMMVATPSLLVPSTGPDTAQIVIVLSILAGFMTFIEYYGEYPSIIEFRFAPPFNRLKFLALSAILIVLSLICRGTTDPTGWTVLFTNMGTALGEAVDFPFSPVRMVVLMMPADADTDLVDLVRTTSGISYTVSIVMMFVFLTLVRLLGWPSRNGAFNVWVNLPLFDPTGGGDVLHRLRRDAGLNIVLGSLLPFLIPAAVRAASDMIGPISIANPQTLIWTMTAWAFLPASMLIRGIAMRRIADMIQEKRRRAYAEDALPGSILQRV
ncbi:hypothetical protein [Roseovarius sp.]|uniref:hypothetical protein n=1 Tax=Roseovarius sp. TaxID=1486281 RepID=UPI00261B740E|nr:hypothetical protein [Roseovarius sp.]